MLSACVREARQLIKTRCGGATVMQMCMCCVCRLPLAANRSRGETYAYAEGRSSGRHARWLNTYTCLRASCTRALACGCLAPRSWASTHVLLLLIASALARAC